MKGGHGTKVAGAAAGALGNVDGEADGVASGAKLHLYDIHSGMCVVLLYCLLQTEISFQLSTIYRE